MKESTIRCAQSTGEQQQSVSVSTTSAASSAVIGSTNALIYSDVACFAVANSNPTATVAAGTPIPANVLIRLGGFAASDKLAFITSTGTGTVYIRPAC